MSIKVNTFKDIITQPLAPYKFLVEIPDFGDTAIVVQSTVFPSEQMRTTTLYIQGEPILYPTVPENSHLWPITVPDNESGDLFTFFENKKRRLWNQKIGALTPDLWETVKVYARTLDDKNVLAAIMHGAWIVGRQDVQLSASDPTINWQWQYAFRFNWLEDVSDLNK